MAVMPIPDDWDGDDWGCYVIEWPNSQKWLGILYGFVTTPLRGRFWDERTGTITDVQEIGREIEERNLDFMSCQDIVNQLSIIAQAVVNVDIAVNQQVNVNQELVNAVNAQSSSIAVSHAWANSISAAYVNNTLIQNVVVDIRDFGAAYPPVLDQEAEASGFTSVSTTEEEACDAAYWIVASAFEMLDWMAGNVLDFYFLADDTILTFLAWAIKRGAEIQTGQPVIQLPGAALTSLVKALKAAYEAGNFGTLLQSMVDFGSNSFDDIVCAFVTGYLNEETALVWDEILQLATTAGLPSPAIPILQAIFNTNVVALVFLKSNLVTFPPRPLGYECCPSPGE